MNAKTCSLFILDYLRKPEHSGATVADLLENCAIRCGWRHNGNPRVYQGNTSDAWFTEALNALGCVYTNFS